MGPVSTEVEGKGRVRALVFDAAGAEFLNRAIECELSESQVIKVSATDGAIFYTAVLHKDFKLNEAAREILGQKKEEFEAYVPCASSAQEELDCLVSEPSVSEKRCTVDIGRED